MKIKIKCVFIPHEKKKKQQQKSTFIFLFPIISNKKIQHKMMYGATLRKEYQFKVLSSRN